MSRKRLSQDPKQALLKRRRQLDARRGEGVHLLDDAERLAATGKLHEALDLFHRANCERPDDPRPLRGLAHCYFDLEQFPHSVAAFDRLFEKDRSRAEDHFKQLVAAMRIGWCGLVLQTSREILARFPEHPLTTDLIDLPQFEQILAARLAETGFPADGGYELEVLHERALAHLQTRDFARAVRLADEFLALWPNFPSVCNNRASALFQLGRCGEAIRACLETSRIFPDNVHALCQLAHYLLVFGRREEATEIYEQVKKTSCTISDQYIRRAEIATLFDDDDEVLRVFESAQRSGILAHDPFAAANLHQLAGAVHLRKGNESEARQHWTQAFRQGVNQQLARECLEDLNRSPAKRQGAWGLTLEELIPTQMGESIGEHLATSADQTTAEQRERELLRFLQADPLWETSLPLVLMHGDQGARELLIIVARALKTPASFEALRKFALGQNGSDQQRMDVMMFLRQHQEVSPGPHSLWLEGTWRPIKLLGGEITREASNVRNLSQAALDLMEQGLLAMRAGEYSQAEALFRRTVVLAEDDPSVWLNLSQAILAQGRQEEAYSFHREIHRRWPDYFFGRVCHAQELIRKRDFAAADELLTELHGSPRFHVTEYDGLMNALLELAWAEEDLAKAKSFFDLWKAANTKGQGVELWEERLTQAGAQGGSGRSLRPRK